MTNVDSRVSELTITLEKVERKLADRETLIKAAIAQSETIRLQYEQANERAETLRRKLIAQEEQSIALQSKFRQVCADLADRDRQIASLQRELRQRDPSIAASNQPFEEAHNALDVINQDAQRQDSANPSERLKAMGLVLEPLDELGTRHRISSPTTTFGRARANDISIKSASVSRYHARIVIESDALHLIDLQSTNGCTVNGQRISRQVITDGDIIAIGDAKFKLSISASLSDVEDRSMDETIPLLNDSEIFIPARRAKSTKMQSQVAGSKTKTK